MTDIFTFGSVCSGIEAASVAWHPLGWRAAWLAEIEPFPSAVLKHHYPEVPNLGDMTTLPDRIRSGEVEAPDLFCGGTPCQAFSVAGLRRSLDDARGNLSLTFCEIANAIDSVRRSAGKPASIIFWENVPGVLSTADNAFGCFLGALAGCDSPVFSGGRWTDAGVVAGPQRTVAWRILDAQYFGLAQRRRRVFVVASARDGFDPAAVLFEWDGVRRDTAPSREARKVASRGASAGAGSGIDFQNAALSGDMAGTLDAEGQRRGNRGHGILAFGGGQNCAQTDVSTSLSAHPGGSRLDFQTETFVTHSLRGEGFDASEDGTGRGTPLVPVCHVDTMPTLRAGAPNGGAGHGARSGDSKDEYIVPVLAGTIEAASGRSHGAGTAPGMLVPSDTTQITSAANRSNPQAGDPCHPLAAGAHPPAIAFHPTQDPISSTDISHAIGTGGGRGCATAAVAFDTYNQSVNSHTSQTIKSPQGAVQESVGTVLQAMQVRRLTPTECERLQGFPDGYTAIPWRKKPASECPDGPRYKALGNSWAVPVVRWIGHRIHHAVQGSNPY